VPVRVLWTSSISPRPGLASSSAASGFITSVTAVGPISGTAWMGDAVELGNTWKGWPLLDLRRRTTAWSSAGAPSRWRQFREVEGLSIVRIADRVGRSPATVEAYYYDQTGQKARAVKARYVAVCRGCGACTQPRHGKGDAYR
jgi:hypothetical protein